MQTEKQREPQKVYGIKWVDDIDESKVTIDNKSIEGTKRKKVFYHHDGKEDPDRKSVV